MMATVDFWAEKFLRKSKDAVLELTPESLDSLERWYTTIDNFKSDFKHYDLLKSLKNSEDAIFAVLAFGLMRETEYADMLWGLSFGNNSKITRDNVYEKIEKLDLRPAHLIQILSKVPGENSSDLNSKLGLLVAEYLEQNPNCPEWELIGMLRYLQFASDPEFLAKSIGFFSHRDWRQRMKTYLFSKQGTMSEVIRLTSNYFENQVLEAALDEFKAENGNSEALDRVLHSGRVTRSKSNKLHEASDVELVRICKAAYLKGAYSDLSAKYLTEVRGLALSDELIIPMAKHDQQDKSLRELVIKLLSQRSHYGYVLAKVINKQLDDFSKFELEMIQRAAQHAGNIDLIVKIHAFSPIEDWQLLARLSADLANIGRWHESEVIYADAVVGLSPTDLLKSKSIRQLRLEGEGLLEYSRHHTIDWSQGLFKLAKLIWAADENYEKTRELLLHGFEMGERACVHFLVQISWGQNLEEKYYISASEPWNAYVSKREYAKYLYNLGRREESIAQAEAAAYGDDEAAHFLIHVLGHNVTKWANFLNDKDSEFTADVFREQFESSGLPMLPKSELETKELHNLEKAVGIGYSKRQIQNGKVVVEKWICHQAFADKSELATWNSASCEFHRKDVSEFQEIGFFKPLNDDHWNQERLTFQENSTPFQLENHPNLERAFQKRALRDWQREAYEKWVRHGRRGIIEAATGSGKSLIGVIAALEALDEGYAVVIVAPTRVLQQQWISQYFLALWNHPSRPIRTIGNEGALYDRPTASITPGTITVAVWKSLRENPQYNPRAGVKSLIIADEVHNYSSKTSENMLDEGYTRRLGLTATLQPPQGRYGALTNFFGGHPLYSYDFGRAVEDKVISAYNLLLVLVPLDSRVKALYTAAYEEMIRQKELLVKVANIPSQPDLFQAELTKLRSRNKHTDIIEAYERAFNESDEYLKESASKAGAVRLIADYIKERGNTIVFSDSFDNARNVLRILESRGVHGKVVNKDVSQPERERIFQELRRKSVKVILSPKALDEGVDISELSTGVFSGTSRRRLQIIQRMGRVLRIAPGKEFPLIVMIAAEGTEEDPRMPNNANLAQSPFGVVYERAAKVGLAHITEEDQIKTLLAQFS